MYLTKFPKLTFIYVIKLTYKENMNIEQNMILKDINNKLRKYKTLQNSPLSPVCLVIQSMCILQTHQMPLLASLRWITLLLLSVGIFKTHRIGIGCKGE